MTETDPLEFAHRERRVFDDILGRLQAAGAEDAIIVSPDGEPIMLDMHGLGLCACPAQRTGRPAMTTARSPQPALRRRPKKLP